MKDLNITVFQTDILWKKNSENLQRYSDSLKNFNEKTDLILLPEMFQTGFCTNPEDISEGMDGETIRWMKRTAELLDCAIAGSLIVKESRRYFNRIVFIDQYQNLTWYDKRHLFSIAGEKTKFTAGRNHLIVPLKGWHLNFQICYDLRFPVWSRNRDNYDILINLANWPANRKEVWNILLQARAIENQCYVVGVNRIGIDGNDIHYTGNSSVIDPRGSIIMETPESEAIIKSIVLSRKQLDDFRSDFPVWKDSDEFEIK